MAARLACPEYRAKVNAVRKARDAERKASDPELRKRLTETSLRHYRNRAPDPEFWVKRKAYLAEWRAKRRDDEAFESYMARIEMEMQCQQ